MFPDSNIAHKFLYVGIERRNTMDKSPTKIYLIAMAQSKNYHMYAKFVQIKHYHTHINYFKNKLCHK